MKGGNTITPLERRNALLANFKSQKQGTEFQPIKRFEGKEVVEAYDWYLTHK